MPAAMKQLLWICAGILLTFTAMLLSLIHI